MTALIIILSIIILLPLVAVLFTKQPKFGSKPSGTRLQKIRAAPNYRNNSFQNTSHTPNFTEGATFSKVLGDFFLKRNKLSRPKGEVPSVKTDMQQLPDKSIIWFGHSGYLIKADGKTIVVDPVLSGAASPLSFTTRSFRGTDPYKPDDFPDIDILVITHDHWDHMDYDTIIKLKPKISKVLTSLGVGAHLERWGFSPQQIIETNWGDTTDLGDGFIANTCSARHFSGRGFERSKSVWSSFALKTPTMNLFIGGDSGYDTHFAETGAVLGPFDLAILECGQYNLYWKHIHMMPEETIQAAIDLKAEVLFPVHWGKFALAMHDWDEPIKRADAEAKRRQVPVITPMVGERVDMTEMKVPFNAWWLELQ